LFLHFFKYFLSNILLFFFINCFLRVRLHVIIFFVYFL
ncbi:hypothetical protein, partial [Plasmodium yoelii yoelii]